jgi:hypothetical protein
MALKTWFITGTLTGFGRALAGALFTRGDRVAEPEYWSWGSGETERDE